MQKNGGGASFHPAGGAMRRDADGLARRAHSHHRGSISVAVFFPLAVYEQERSSAYWEVSVVTNLTEFV